MPTIASLPAIEYTAQVARATTASYTALEYVPQTAKQTIASLPVVEFATYREYGVRSDAYETIYTTSQTNIILADSFEWIQLPLNTNGMADAFETITSASPAKRHVWDGTQWVRLPEYAWNGSAWVVIV